MLKTIAIPTTNNLLDAHFGHCRSFTLFEVNENTILSVKTIDAPPHVPGKLPGWLADQGATEIIAGGMGQSAIDLFNSYRVNVFVGAPALKPEEIVDGYLNNSLQFKANYCNH